MRAARARSCLCINPKWWQIKQKCRYQFSIIWGQYTWFFDMVFAVTKTTEDGKIDTVNESQHCRSSNEKESNQIKSNWIVHHCPLISIKLIWIADRLRVFFNQSSWIDWAHRNQYMSIHHHRSWVLTSILKCCRWRHIISFIMQVNVFKFMQMFQVSLWWYRLLLMFNFRDWMCTTVYASVCTPIGFLDICCWHNLYHIANSGPD